MRRPRLFHTRYFSAYEPACMHCSKSSCILIQYKTLGVDNQPCFTSLTVYRDHVGYHCEQTNNETPPVQQHNTVEEYDNNINAPTKSSAAGPGYLPSDSYANLTAFSTLSLFLNMSLFIWLLATGSHRVRTDLCIPKWDPWIRERIPESSPSKTHVRTIIIWIWEFVCCFSLHLWGIYNCHLTGSGLNSLADLNS